MCFARPFGLVSNRHSVRPPRTSSAPTAHLSSPSLTHCANIARSGAPVLVTLGASCPLELVNFGRRTPAGWRGARAGYGWCKTGSRNDAMPSPPSLRISLACCPGSFCFFLPTCLPCPRYFVKRLAVRFRCFCCLQQDRTTLSFHISLPSPPFQFCPRNLLRLSCSLCRQQCRRRSPRRISSSEPMRRVLGSTRRL